MENAQDHNQPDFLAINAEPLEKDFDRNIQGTPQNAEPMQSPNVPQIGFGSAENDELLMNTQNQLLI